MDFPKNEFEEDFDDENLDKLSKKDLLIGKRKDKKDKGYATLGGESSAEDDETKSPSKVRKSKTFKFSSKKEKREKSRDKESKEKEIDKKKEPEKDKKKEPEKDKKKEVKGKIRKKKLKSAESIAEELPIFGVSLELAVERSPCHDGVMIPLPVRQSIDYIQQHGLTTEGTYKTSGIKSKVQHICNLYNRREVFPISDFDVPTATSLLKYFLRVLPGPIITKEMVTKLDDNKDKETVRSIFMKLSPCGKTVIAWLFLHFKDVVAHEKENKVSISMLSNIYSPVLQIPVKLFNYLVTNISEIFPDVNIFRYVPPMRCISPDMPIMASKEDIESELKKQESLLGLIHFEMNCGFVSKDKEELLWTVQRNITQLKRTIKMIDRKNQRRSSEAQECPSNSDADIEVSANISDGNGYSEKMEGDTICRMDMEKQLHESSQEFQYTDESEDEEAALIFESGQLIILTTLEDKIKEEKRRIADLKSKFSQAGWDSSVSEYFGVIGDYGVYDDDSEASREYNMLQLQRKNLNKSIEEEQRTIIDLKLQILSMQTKNEVICVSR